MERHRAPRDIYERPRRKFVADFLGSTNVVDGCVVDRARPTPTTNTAVASEIGTVRAYAIEPLADGDPVVLSIRPEDPELCEHDPDGDNVYRKQRSNP